jgi:N6-adenosine-specific RNA methylase IME4
LSDNSFILTPAEKPVRRRGRQSKKDISRKITLTRQTMNQSLLGNNEFEKPTGYSIYSKMVKVRTKQNTLNDIYPELPNQKFDIIYADPPWDYNGKLQFDKSSISKEKLDLGRSIFVSSAYFKYPTLKTVELMKLSVQQITKNDCLLFMWTSNPHLAQAIQLGEAWGFEYRTVAFIWDKMNHNPGQYTLSNCELCLVFKHGKIPRPRGARNIQQLIRSPRKEHSEKPIEVMQAIEKMFPTQEKIELFARRKIEGWSSWGLDIIINNDENSHQQVL